MALEQRIEALRQRHGHKEAELQAEESRLAPNAEKIHQIKREKLLLKDEMLRLESDREARAA